jgi:DNA-binding transcriptional LysR family regulator
MILELQRFLLAANEGSITKTAEKVFITQSALTQSIQRLEKELQMKLFSTQGKHLQLTEEGKALVVIGTKIIKLWTDAKHLNLQKNYSENYSIGIFDNAALKLSPYLKNAIISNQFKLELTIDSSTKLFSQLKLGVLDAAICVLSKRNILPKNIKLIQTFGEQLIPVSSKKFDSNIEKIPFIFYNKDSHTREQTDIIFKEKNINPTIFAESTSTTFMKELALLGSGVALLPKNYIKSELAQKTLIKHRFTFILKRDFGLFVNEESVLKKDHPIIKNLIKGLTKTT